jgi:hypothetical protein
MCDGWCDLSVVLASICGCGRTVRVNSHRLLSLCGLLCSGCSRCHCSSLWPHTLATELSHTLRRSLYHLIVRTTIDILRPSLPVLVTEFCGPLVLPPLQLRPIMKSFSGVRAGSRQSVSGVATSRSVLSKSHATAPQQQQVQQRGSRQSSLLPLVRTPASSSRSNVSCQAAATAVAPASAVGAVRRGETAGAVLVLEDVTVQVSNCNRYTAAVR